MNKAIPYLLVFFGCLLLASVQLSSCHKEYSFEGADTTQQQVDTTSIQPDTITTTFILPPCSFCTPRDTVPLNDWQFQTGASYLCGTTTNAGFIGGKTTITFFGPSTCSTDTGIVMTVYLPVPLDQDRYHVTTSEAAFFYYDNNAPNDILISRPGVPFHVTIDTFTLSTQMVSGTFSGTAFTPSDSAASIQKGLFKVKLN